MIKITFTISQTPDSANLYLYPDGSSATQHISSGTANYEMVNDIWHTPVDTDYVYSTSISTATDWYGLPDHTTETGTINYVQVIARAGASPVNQVSGGSYYILIDDSSSSDKSSNKAPIVKSFTKYYNVWSTKPSGGAWTWTDIDAMEIGFDCSSPSISTVTFTVFPNGDIQTNLNSGGVHWEQVADDNDNTIVWAENQDSSDLYTFAPIDTVFDTIHHIEIFAKVKVDDTALGNNTYKYHMVTGGNTFYGLVHNLTDESYELVSDVSYTNPDSSASWTTSDIASLHLGPNLLSDNDGDDTYCCQYYIKATYASISPRIKTSQCYTVVNYTPSTTTVTLTTPDSLSVSHGRNIERFAFASGDYEVIDTGRASKTLQLSGIETTTAGTKMQGVRDQMHYGSEVTIAGLPDSNLNTNYYITGFGSEDVSYGSTLKYRWSLTLEEA